MRPICAIFKSSDRDVQVPQVWNMANITAVPKIKPPKVLDPDLQPISLL